MARRGSPARPSGRGATTCPSSPPRIASGGSWIAAQLTRATALGAEIRTGCEVLALDQDAAGIRIETADGVILADRAVVAAGAWTAPLLGAPFDTLLTVRRQLLHWYALADE